MKVALGILGFVGYVLLADWLFGRRIEFTLAAIGFGLTGLAAVLRLRMILREADAAALTDQLRAHEPPTVLPLTADERRAERARLQALLQHPRGSARLERVK